MMKVGVTGGIGSGKSTVCRLFAARGVAVYDSDAAAKELMTTDPIRTAVVAHFGAEAYTAEGALNRVWLAQRVFSDEAELHTLNAIVHPAVRADFEQWAAQQQGDYVVLESAILFESGFDVVVDYTVAVLAPVALRVERTCRRDASDPERVRMRIAAQMDDDTLCAKADYTIVNILEEELEPAVKELDYRFRHVQN